ncbi:Putative carbamate hydrolase RutD-like protein [Cladobotryum mycophilum]|uniref:Carbamate hydrolase RutD-like protein n=1 Tax=Cladobotryum mycophilum TaxID=491253 RepID=A0ABR0SFV5_9HYPO
MASYETVNDQYIKVGDITFAYRLFGSSHGIPLVCVTGFREHMDHWDPALLNPLAAQRPVLLIDNAGIGRSGGDIPDTLTEWATHYVNVIHALGFRRVDLLGFSMGGCVVQLVALNTPDLVRRLILCGTGPSSGEGYVNPEPRPFKDLKSANTVERILAVYLANFFTEDSERSQAAGRAAWERITNARSERLPHIPPEAAHKQTRAYAKFMDPKNAQTATYNRLHELRLPVLIANGSNDIMMPTANSILMWQKLKSVDAQLHLYPDSGHGFFYQYADEFATLVNGFLGTDATGRVTSSRL